MQSRSKVRNRPKENAQAGRDKFPFCTFVLHKYGQYNKCRIETIGGESGVWRVQILNLCRYPQQYLSWISKLRDFETAVKQSWLPCLAGTECSDISTISQSAGGCWYRNRSGIIPAGMCGSDQGYGAKKQSYRYWNADGLLPWLLR